MINLEEDKLNRGSFLDDLFNIFENFGNFDDGGLTISINGKYGSGKSTILNFIEQKNNIDNKFDIVMYDAWQNNFFSNPIIPILYTLNKLERRDNKLLAGAKAIIKKLPKMFANTLANAHSIDLSALCTNENIFEEYERYNDAITKYKNLLTALCKNKKIILLVDELDRCLPKYQIQVLETLYSIFNIPNLILVVAIDKMQLEHSIKQLFGCTTNVSGYLSKFIQYEIDLPENQNSKYLQALLMFECKYPEIKQICAKMFDLANVSLRNALQIVKEMNLICNETNKDGQPIQYQYWIPIFVCLVLIIKKELRNIYKEYFDQENIPEKEMEIKTLEQTNYFNFLNSIKGTKIEAIINFFISNKMNFAFILYFINYFYSINYIDKNSLIKYTNYKISRIESVIDSWETQMWERGDFGEILHKIKIFK